MKKLYHGNACNRQMNEYDWNPKTGGIRKNEYCQVKNIYQH